MNQDRLTRILLAPRITEKTNLVAESSNQVVVRVALDANKQEIKQAIEKLFDVKVKDVTTVRQRGKAKRFSQRQGKRVDFKKAYVRLHEGHDINFGLND